MAFPEAHRLSLARDLHDTVLQEFLVIVMQLRRIEESVGSEAGRRVAFGLQAATRGIDCARRLLVDLRSSPSSAVSPAPAVTLATELAETLDAVLAHTALRPSLRCPHGLALPPRVQREVVNIVREATTNVVRHAGASRVACRVDIDGSVVTVVVEDDGRGLPATGREGHGLTGMRERAALVGATLRIDGRDGGTTIRLTLPLHEPPRHRPALRSSASPTRRATVDRRLTAERVLHG